MGFVRLLPRSSARARDAAAEAELEAALETELDAMPELEADVSEPDAGDMMGLPALDDLTAIEESPVAVSTPVASAPVVIPQAPAPGATGTRVIALANQKGGVAKTTTTLNLGVAFKEMGYRVLLVDLDPQGNLTMSQGLNPDTIETSMFDVLVRKIPISDVIEKREVDLAVASIDLAGAELALAALIGRERSLEKALFEVRDRYDFILIDTPPSLGLLTINAFVAATGVIVPVQCEYLALRGLVQLENTLAMVRENLNPRVGVEGIVPTMYDARTLHAREAVESWRRTSAISSTRPGFARPSATPRRP